MTPCIRLYGKYVFPASLRRFFSAERCPFPAFAPELFSESHCGTVCAGNFIRGKACCGACHDFLLGQGINISSFGMVASAFVGSLLAMSFVLLISFYVSRMSLLVVCGIMIGYICSAITDFCVTFADDSNIVNLHNWSMGSFSGMTWDNIRMMAVLVGITIVITFLLAKPIGAYQLGESYARNMGVNVKALRVALILLSSLLSACVTAFAGPISL